MIILSDKAIVYTTLSHMSHLWSAISKKIFSEVGIEEVTKLFFK